MQKIEMMGWNDPRGSARQAIQQTISQSDWQRNTQLISRIRSNLRQHKIATHPAISALRAGAFSQAAIKQIHLEYRHAIVQIFTDALLMAQFQCRQLEPVLQSGSKMHARFLLNLNNLDEFGFRPGEDIHGYYRGNSWAAHYPLFEALLDDMGVTQAERKAYLPSQISSQIRSYLESSYHSLNQVLSLLAVGEEVVVLFSAPLRVNTKAVGINVDSGYYMCHGTSDDEQAEANDDTHEDDLWFILNSSLLSEESPAISQLCQQYCDLWVLFWDRQMMLLKEVHQSSPNLVPVP